MEKFCTHYNLKEQKYSLPPNGLSTLNFYKRLLTNDEARTIFCVVPKVSLKCMRANLGYINLKTTQRYNVVLKKYLLYHWGIGVYLNTCT